MFPKISVIIPVYNVEEYLDKCINSVLGQTFKEFELILINDGSTDRSGDICNEYEKEDKRIIAIHKENGGSSETRNIGISRACGKYICFVDSDDWIEKNMLQEKFNISEKYSSDITISGIEFDRVDEKGNIKTFVNTYPFSVWNTVNKIKKNIISLFPNALINSSCNKLYRTQLLKEIGAKFENTNVGEDTLFNLDIIKHSTCIVVAGEVYYHYMKYETYKTLTNKVIEDAYDRYIQIHQKMNELFDYWEARNCFINDEINKTMFAQYFATTLKILKADKKMYSYKIKKALLNNGLENKFITDTFNSSPVTSYKEKVFRLAIKKRFYFLVIILMKIKEKGVLL